MKRVLYYGAWTLLGISIIVCLYSAIVLYQKSRDNQLIELLNSGRTVDEDALSLDSAAVALAYSSYLNRRHRYDEALAVISRISRQLKDPKLKLISQFNLGNIYLTQAIEAATSMKIDDAMALTGLAKNAYRRALLIDSHYWDAKYNLEVAMRLLPEMDRVTMQEEPVSQKKARPWTTIPGFPRGLP